MTEVVALLHRPHPKSFGIVPYVGDEDGHLEVSGLSDASRHRAELLTRDALSELVQGGHALTARAPIEIELPDNAVALWIGHDFAVAADQIGLSAPPLPPHQGETSGGRFAIGGAKEMYVYLEQWTERAFARLVTLDGDSEAQRKIAALMRWALPADPKTLAALWRSSADPDRELAWQLRTFRKGSTSIALADELRGVLGNAVNAPKLPLLYVVTGGSGVKRGDVAEDLTNKLKLKAKGRAIFLASFEKPLEQEAPEQMDTWDRKQNFAHLGQRRVERAPLAFAVDALRESILLSDLIVLDSLRHFEAYEAIQWLFPQAVVIGVDASFECKRQRWKSKGQPEEQFDSWLKGPLERSIPRLLKHAAKVISTDHDIPEREVDEVANEALAQLG